MYGGGLVIVKPSCYVTSFAESCRHHFAGSWHRHLEKAAELFSIINLPAIKCMRLFLWTQDDLIGQ